MRKRFLSLACLAILSLCAAASAQQATTPSDPQPSALLLRALAALTGGAALTDVTLMGTTTRIAGSDNESGQATLKALAAGVSRMDFNLTSGARSEIRTLAADGTPAGSWTGPDGVSHPMARHNLWTPSAWYFPAFTVSQILSSSAYAATYVGTETRGGVPVQHVRATIPAADPTDPTATLTQHLSQVDIYLDASSLLPVSIAFNIHPDRNAGLDIPAEVQFSDYRSVSAALVPFHVQQFLQNGLVFDFQLQNAVLNTGLTSAVFALQ